MNRGPAIARNTVALRNGLFFEQRRGRDPKLIRCRIQASRIGVCPHRTVPRPPDSAAGVLAVFDNRPRTSDIGASDTNPAPAAVPSRESRVVR